MKENIQQIIEDITLKISDGPIDENLIKIQQQGILNRCQLIINTFDTLASNNANLKGLEIGISTGTLLLSLIELLPNIDWHGIDIPNRHVKHMKEYENLFHNYLSKIKECDLNHDPLPYPDSSFDFVSFSEILEHLPPSNIVPILKEIKRILKPGGYVVATSPNLTSMANRILMLFGISPFKLPLIEEDKYGCKTFPHIHLYTPNEFSGLGNHVGLQTTKTKYITYLSYTFLRNNLHKKFIVRLYMISEKSVSWLFPSLKDGWLVVQQKDKTKEEKE